MEKGLRWAKEEEEGGAGGGHSTWETAWEMRKGKERRILASSADMGKNVPIAWRFLENSWGQASKQCGAPL